MWFGSKHSFAGHVAIVTGASAGIGRAIASRLARERVKLVLAARSEQKLAELAEELSSHGETPLAVPTDVTSLSDLERLVNRTREHFGRIDVLVNNAGLGEYLPFESQSIDEMDAMVEVNLQAALRLSRLTIPIMLEQGGGKIVNIASTAGKLSPPFGVAYAATKAGLIAMSYALRSEFGKRGITATAICPGFTDEGGIYERMKASSGRDAPFFVGKTSVERVTESVLRGMKSSPPEIVVNFPPLRPILTLLALSPRIGSSLVNRVSFRYLKKVATLNLKAKG